MATPDASTAARSARPGANVAAALEHTAAVRASAEAVIDGDVRFDYATLGRRIAGVGAGLLSLGLAPGDVVATLALNSYRHLECWLAIPRVGLVLNELNTRLAAAELAFILDDSEARICWIAGPVDQEPWATRAVRRGAVRRCRSLHPPARRHGRRHRRGRRGVAARPEHHGRLLAPPPGDGCRAYPGRLVSLRGRRPKRRRRLCAEVENALCSHPAVLEAAVFGVPDERWVERVHAAVVLRADGAAGEDELTDHCRALIAGYKLPRSYELRSEPLPKSGAGKILKRELRAPHWEGHRTAIA